MAIKRKKKCSASLVLRERQFSCPMRYHFTSIRITISKNLQSNLQMAWREENPPNVAGKCKWVHPLGRTLWRFFKKQNIEVWSDPAIPCLDVDLEKTKIFKNNCNWMIMAALGTLTKTGKQLKCGRTDGWVQKVWKDRWMGAEDGVHIHNVILLRS